MNGNSHEKTKKKHIYNIVIIFYCIIINLSIMVSKNDSFTKILFAIVLICFLANLILCIIHLKRMKKNEDENKNDNIN